MRSSRLVIGLIIAAVSGFLYFSNTQVNPVTGEKQRVAMTPDQEVALGIQSAPQMAEQFGGLLPNSAIQAYVKEVGRRVAASSNAKESPYRFDFHVLSDPQTVNAFALPGGQIFITAALLKRLQNEAQLAGVLGHEVGHVIGRHSAEHMAKAQLTQGLVGAAGVAGSGDGGGQTAVLQSVAAEVAAERKVRTLVINWWSFASDETKEVFGEDGGHAGLNETAFIQAIDPKLVHPERYSGPDMTTVYPAAGTWSAVPFPSSIGLYQKGQGYPKFDQAKADDYYKKVTDKVANFVNEIVKKWNMAGL